MRSKKNYSNVVASNRRATYDYEILDKVEAGLVLMSSEVKSIRDNRVSLAGSYAYPFNGELWLNNAHIAIYPYSTRNNHEPLRSRKLLLKKRKHRLNTTKRNKEVSASMQNLSALRLN